MFDLMQYALIFYDFQLILAQMPLPPVGVEVWQRRNVQLIAIAIPGGLRINPYHILPCTFVQLKTTHVCRCGKPSSATGQYRVINGCDIVLLMDKYRVING
jgi:hypothetical protein